MMEFFNLIADFFNSLQLEYKVLMIAGASALVAFVVVLCCVLGYKKHKKKKREIKEKNEKSKQALDDFMSTPSDGNEELCMRFNGNKELDVTSEPEIDEVEEPIIDEEQESAGQEVDKEHVIERSEDIDAEFCEDIERANESVDFGGQAQDSDEEKDVFAFVKDKEKKAPAGFETKLAEADSLVKANYCDIVNYALSYKKLKLRKSANSEKGYCGSNLLFMFKIHGKSLRVYYALRFADYEHSTMPVSNESGKKSYDKTPVMLKITGPLSVKRAKMLIDDVAKRFAMEQGKEKTVITAEEL